MDERTHGSAQEHRGGSISEPDENGIRYFDAGVGYTIPAYSQAPLTAKKKRPLWKNLLIFVGILAAIFLVAIYGFGESGNSKAAAVPSTEYIAELHVEGTIQSKNTDTWGRAVGYQHDWTMNTIDELIKDKRNHGIILFIDSPGGTIYESDELYLKIKEYQDKTKRPVYAVMGSMAASGGYYISAPCDKIYANRNTWTGSIGVTVGNIYDFSEFLSKYGIKVKTITSGPNKAMGSSVQPMSAEEEAIWRSLVNEAYLQFVGVVAEGRGFDTAYVKSIADGRIYSASQAKNIGLIDNIGGVDEAYAQMLKQNKMTKDSCILADMEFVGESSIFDSLFTKLSGIANLGSTNEATVILNFVEGQGGYPASYLCEALAQ